MWSQIVQYWKATSSRELSHPLFKVLVWKIIASFAFSWGWCYKLQHSCSLHLLTLKSRWKSLLSHSFPGCIFNKVGEFVEGNRLMVDVCIIRPAACHQCVKNLFLPFLLSTCLSPCYISWSATMFKCLSYHDVPAWSSLKSPPGVEKYE